jgi:hypothetical protein
VDTEYALKTAEALILGKFADQLAGQLYGSVGVGEVTRFLSRDIRIALNESFARSHGLVTEDGRPVEQVRFITLIGPTISIRTRRLDITPKPTSLARKAFGEGFSELVGNVLRTGNALQVALHYGTWAKGASITSSEVQYLEKIMIEFEGTGEAQLDIVRKAAREAADALSPYGHFAFEYSGGKSIYLIAWLPEPVSQVEAGGVTVPPVEVHRALFTLLLGRLDKPILAFVDRQFTDAKKLLRVPGFRHEGSGRPAQWLDGDLKPTDFDPGVMSEAVIDASVVRLAVEDAVRRLRARPSASSVASSKVEAWGRLLEAIRRSGKKVTDGRDRFAYNLGCYCAAAGLSREECYRIAEEVMVDAYRYRRRVDAGFRHPEYLPRPDRLFKAGRWYNVSDVPDFEGVRGVARVVSLGLGGEGARRLVEGVGVGVVEEVVRFLSARRVVPYGEFLGRFGAGVVKGILDAGLVRVEGGFVTLARKPHSSGGGAGGSGRAN